MKGFLMDKINATDFLILHEFSFLYLAGIYFCKYWQTSFVKLQTSITFKLHPSFFANHDFNLVMGKDKSH